MGVGYSSSALYETRCVSKKEVQECPLRNLGREVELSINGKQHNVSDNVPADTTLNAYIREYAHLKGTKFMCLEGGCGACIVSVTTLHPATGKHITQAVNSCLVPIFACHGWEVTTIEGLGNKKAGYNKITKRLAAANGTQCGYCSPAMVMNMYSLLESNPKITMKEVENSFGGNICRCTGYRPILDAFKSFASDAPNDLVSRLADIEDMICPSNGQKCTNDDFCFLSCPHKLFSPSVQGLHFQLEDGASWFRPANKQEIFEILDMIGEKSYRFIAGNTGHGVYRVKEEPMVYIDINGVRELHGAEVTSDGLTLGANMALTETMEFFYRVAAENPNMFTYCRTLADHIDLVANVPVRNLGTLAGNLSMKHQYKEFPSDIFLFLEMVGAEVHVADPTGEMQRMKLLEYLETDMNRKIIVKILLPKLNNDWYIVRSYKIMPRAQNAHAYINAGFMIKVDKKNFTVQEKPNIIFGGIRPEFLHAVKTEEYLKGKNLLCAITLKGALEVLDSELEPDHVLPDASPVFRKGLALSLFYKFILSVAPDRVSEKYRSGGSIFDRPVSSAKQDFQTDSSLWPLNKPIPKIEALIQCAGEAEYVNDIPCIPGQLWGQLVLSDRGGAVVAKIDPSEALKMKGVVAFFSAEDIPGKNTFYSPGMFLIDDEKIFSDGRTSYAGEAVGVIIADSHTLALKAAKRVKVEYSDQRKLVTNLREIVSKNMTDRIKETWKKIEPKKQGSDIKYKISGNCEIRTQYHYTMETLTCLAVPTEDHLVVYPATQWPSFVQEAISIALKIPENMIDIRVRRLGGAYGAKVTRVTHTAVVACLAAHLLQRPVRLVLSLETNMEWMGKRFPVYSHYEVGVNGEGVVQYMTTRMYQDTGFADNDSGIFITVDHTRNCYDCSTWDVKGYSVKTDTAANSWCRAPASTEALCLIETIMEHIANVTGKEPMEVRCRNLDPEDKVILPFCEEMKKISDYDKRLKEIDQYNKANRWKKRGMSLVPMKYHILFFGSFHATVSIFQLDGSVSVTHGGVEMGQGINTKAVQVAAKILNIDIWQVTVKPGMTAIHPNNGSSGGSVASESVCYAVMKCCEELNERLAPIKKELGEKATWAEICNAASIREVNLSATYMEKASELKPYFVYGAAVTEVEVDILTGQYHTVRADILEDAGESMSPEVDIGQIEGAFLMGLGYYTCEEIVYEADTGRLLTNRTWNYKPPGAKDIPLDFRVTLQKNVPNPFGVLRSKATGEPPFCLSCSVLYAIRNAVESARKDTGIKQELWFDFEQPYTVERIWLGDMNYSGDQDGENTTLTDHVSDIYSITVEDSNWIMTAAFIIFTMQTGFGMLESGCVSRKNEMNIMMKNVVDIFLGGVTYWAVGYGMSFGQSWSCPVLAWGDWLMDDGPGSTMGPKFTSFLFQLSFATTATTIVSGSMAERCNFKAYCIFSFLNTVVYCVPAGWVWGGHGFLKKLGAVDIAGSGPVHLVGGVSAFTSAFCLGPRLGRYDYGNDPLPLGTPVNCAMGLFVLWWGWLAFNSGSTYGVSGMKWAYAAKASVMTMISSFGGGIVGLLYSLVINDGHANILDIINSVLGSLVSVTAGCFLYTSLDAFLIGCTGALITSISTPLFDVIKVDDPVGATAVHGVSGIWGVLAVGLFAENPVPLTTTNGRCGLLKGCGSYLLGVQALSALCLATYSFLTTYLILWSINKFVPIRMPAVDELLGADLSEHLIRHNDDGVSSALAALKSIGVVTYDYSKIKAIGSNPGHESFLNTYVSEMKEKQKGEKTKLDDKVLNLFNSIKFTQPTPTLAWTE